MNLSLPPRSQPNYYYPVLSICHRPQFECSSSIKKRKRNNQQQQRYNKIQEMLAIPRYSHDEYSHIPNRTRPRQCSDHPTMEQNLCDNQSAVLNPRFGPLCNIDLSMTIPLLSPQNRKEYSTYNLYLAALAVPNLFFNAFTVSIYLMWQEWAPEVDE